MNGLSFVLIVILIGAILLGVAIAKPEVFHPVETQIMSAAAKAELDAKIKEYAETLQFHENLHAVTVVFYSTFTRELLFITALFATVFALGGGFYLCCLGVVMIIRARRDVIQAQNEQLRLLATYSPATFPHNGPIAAAPATLNGAAAPSPRRYP